MSAKKREQSVVDLGVFADMQRCDVSGGVQAAMRVLVVTEPELGASEVDVVVRPPLCREMLRRMPGRRALDSRRAVTHLDSHREFVDTN